MKDMTKQMMAKTIYEQQKQIKALEDAYQDAMQQLLCKTLDYADDMCTYEYRIAEYKACLARHQITLDEE